MSSGPSPFSTTGGTGLPRELEQRAVRRLGVLALVSVGTWLVMRAVFFAISPDFGRTLDTSDAMLVIAVVLSLAMFWLTRWQKLRASTLLDIGLVYVLTIAFLIATADNSRPWAADYTPRGAPFLTWWLLLFPTLVPAPIRKTAPVALIGALMAPAALEFQTRVLGLPPSPSSIYIRQFVFCVVAGGIGLIPGRVLYNLGRRVSEALELGSYRLVKKIGVGAMGEVWSAEHVALARPAAIKVIKPGALADGTVKPEVVLARFEREARAIAGLRSPHTVVLYDYGVAEDSSFYFVMELLDGANLRDVIADYGALEPARVAHILVGVCESLAEAHDRNLIHRDIKPANVYVCDYGGHADFVKVLDFGLVKEHGEPQEAKLTADGKTTGTPAYMSPEMALGLGDVDHRSDIYAVGCLAYYLLTGTELFEAATAVRMLMAQIESAPEDVAERAEQDIPRELADIIMQCLEKDRADRPQDTRALARSLRPLARDWTEDKARAFWRDAPTSTSN